MTESGSCGKCGKRATYYRYDEPKGWFCNECFGGVVPKAREVVYDEELPVFRGNRQQRRYQAKLARGRK